MSKLDDHPLAVSGSWGDIRFFRRPNGECLALRYYDGLADTEKNQFVVRFRKLSSAGRLFNESQYRALKGADALYEFKTYDHRLTCYQCKRTWFLLHGFAKKGQKTNRRDLELAKCIRLELLEFLKMAGPEVCRDR